MKERFNNRLTKPEISGRIVYPSTRLPVYPSTPREE
jgi:hypothetical protein